MANKKYFGAFLYNEGVRKAIEFSELYDMYGLTTFPTDVVSQYYYVTNDSKWGTASSIDGLHYGSEYFYHDLTVINTERTSRWFSIDTLLTGLRYISPEVATAIPDPVAPSNNSVTIYDKYHNPISEALTLDTSSGKLYLIKDMYNGDSLKWLTEDEVYDNGYTLDNHDKPLFFRSVLDKSKVALVWIGNSPDSYEISYDNSNWQSYTIGEEINLSKNARVYFRVAPNTSQTRGLNNHPEFRMSGLVEAYGSVNSLVAIEYRQSGYAFYKLFSCCASLLTAPELTFTTVGYMCYGCMFEYCSSLEIPPKLPATTFSNAYPYHYMFRGCLSLKHAPELPATTLTDHCYAYMFQDCRSLMNAPKLPATTLATNCYYGMFYWCSSLITPPELPATTLANYCYYSMFEYCTSLKHAPELPATVLKYMCYYRMFYNCTALEVAPKLHATTLAKYCYSYIFQSCRNITQVYCAASATEFANSGTGTWLDGVGASGELYTIATDSLTTANGIPSSWAIGVYDPNDYVKYGRIDYNGQWRYCEGVLGISTEAIPSLSDYIFARPTRNERLSSSSTEMHIRLNLSSQMTFPFFVGMSCELSYDKLNVKLDGVAISTIDEGNQRAMRQLDIQVPQGEHVITFEYKKDSSVDRNLDTVYVAIPINHILVNYWQPDGLMTLDLMEYKQASFEQAQDLIAVYDYDRQCYILEPLIEYSNMDRYNSLGSPNFSLNNLLDVRNSSTSLAYIPKCDRILSYHKESGAQKFLYIFYDNVYRMYKYYDRLLTHRWVTESQLESLGYTLQAPEGTIDEALCFTNSGSTPATVELTMVGYLRMCEYEYATGDNPTQWNDYTIGDKIILGANGNKVYIRGSRSQQSSSNYIKFKMTGRISASGNISSLLTGKGISNYSMSEHPSYAFYSLFSCCSSLISPPTVSVERVKEYSYYGMFEYCTSLESTPELPATDISQHCYDKMFQYCTSLKSCVLELSAPVLQPYCYYYMFFTCASLETPPKLPATYLSASCYQGMFSHCASLRNVPELPATSLVSFCYYGMFNDCAHLNSVSVILPADTILSYSCFNMFNGSKDIKEVYCYAKSIHSAGCSTWLSDDSPDKVFYGYASANWPRSSSGVPSQWKFVALPEYEVKFVGQWKPVSFVDEPDKATVDDGWVAFKSYSNFNIHNSHSDMLIEVNVPTDTAIFHFKAMSYGEVDCDYLISYIDDIQYDIYDDYDYHTWTDIYITVSKGKHMLKFSYIKDGSVSHNPDCAYLSLPVAELDVVLQQDPEPTPQYAYSRSSAYQTSNNQLQNATITGIYEQGQNGTLQGDTHKDYEITGMWLANGSALTLGRVGLSCYIYSGNPCIRIYNQTGGVVTWNKLEYIERNVFRLYLAQDRSDLSLDTGSQVNYCCNRNGISTIYRTTNETYTLVGACNSSGESVDYSQLTVGYTSSLHNMYVANNGSHITLSYVEFTVSGGDGVA